MVMISEVDIAGEVTKVVDNFSMKSFYGLYKDGWTIQCTPNSNGRLTTESEWTDWGKQTEAVKSGVTVLPAKFVGKSEKYVRSQIEIDLEKSLNSHIKSELEAKLYAEEEDRLHQIGSGLMLDLSVGSGVNDTNSFEVDPNRVAVPRKKSNHCIYFELDNDENIVVISTMVHFPISMETSEWSSKTFTSEVDARKHILNVFNVVEDMACSNERAKAERYSVSVDFQKAIDCGNGRVWVRNRVRSKKTSYPEAITQIGREIQWIYDADFLWDLFKQSKEEE